MHENSSTPLHCIFNHLGMSRQRDFGSLLRTSAANPVNLAQLLQKHSRYDPVLDPRYCCIFRIVGSLSKSALQVAKLSF